MALDYLSIPGESYLHILGLTLIFYLATSVDVERVFSKGRLLFSHVRNRLSAQTTRALMCVGAWSLLGYVLNDDVLSVTRLPDLEEGEEEETLSKDWDMVVRIRLIIDDRFSNICY